MNQYLATVVYQIICGAGNHAPQFDEQLRLVFASDETLAFVKAMQIGKQEEQIFLNEGKQLVQWRFVNVSQLHCINQHVDAAEVYSTIREVTDATGYISLVNAKAHEMERRFLK